MSFVATCGPRDYFTEWSKSKTNIIWYHLHVEPNKIIWKKTHRNRSKLSDFKTNLMVTIGKTNVGGKV